MQKKIAKKFLIREDAIYCSKCKKFIPARSGHISRPNKMGLIKCQLQNC